MKNGIKTAAENVVREAYYSNYKDIERKVSNLIMEKMQLQWFPSKKTQNFEKNFLKRVDKLILSTFFIYKNMIYY